MRVCEVAHRATAGEYKDHRVSVTVDQVTTAELERIGQMYGALVQTLLPPGLGIAGQGYFLQRYEVASTGRVFMHFVLGSPLDETDGTLALDNAPAALPARVRRLLPLLG